MEDTTFFGGLTFNFFGIDVKSNSNTKTWGDPLFHSIQYVHSGPLSMRLNDGNVLQLNGPFAFLNSPRLNIHYGSPGKNTRSHYFVCFSGDRVNRYLESGLFCLPEGRSYVRINSSERFLGDILELILLLQNKDRHNFAVAKLEYILLLLQKQENCGSSVSFHQAALEQLSRQIMSSPEQDWNFQEEASRLNISLKHFMRLFLKIHGMPPCRFVLCQRLFKAGGMLIQEKLPVKAIAYDCGFHNEFYFSRAFKKYMHLAPEDYRNKNHYTMGTFIPSHLPEKQ